MPTLLEPIQPRAATASVASELVFDGGLDLVIAIDTLVDGVHFPPGTAAADVGFKALAVNLSDLAAMAAEPRRALVSITHPHQGEARGQRWLDGFDEGFATLAQRYALSTAPLLTARGPLCVTVEVLGTVPHGAALRRCGASPGDRVVVTGTLGDAGLALAAANPANGLQTSPWLQARLARPEPRVEAGIALRGLASAAIDISDGLVADLGHILQQSGAGARLIMEQLPLSPAVMERLQREDAWRHALSCGDDYELCFTLASHRLEEAEDRLAAIGCAYTSIGTIVQGSGLQCMRSDGSRFDAAPGYRHFS
jgi:thiamine-monophosphate kinase